MKNKVKRLMSKEEIEAVHDDEEKAIACGLLKKIWSTALNKEILVYNFENKSRVQVLHEILSLPLPNGNKHCLLLEYLKIIEDKK